MIFHPTIISLLLSSILIGVLILYSALFGVHIIIKWNISSGSELQLRLERRTYLISTIVKYLLVIQIVSLFLFIFIADSIHTLFTGAMCAVGTLTVNKFGYVTLFLKLITFFIAGIWMVLNYADNEGYDYPLINIKYIILLILAPLIVTENITQLLYFLNLRPDIITSCCGSLFSSANKNIATEIANVPSIPTLEVFFSIVIFSCLTGLFFYFTDHCAYVFSILSIFTGLISVIAVISVLSLYIYQMPSHHCPFCILQKEYNYIGYPIYFLILGGSVTGAGVGILQPYRKVKSITESLPILQKRLSMISVLLFAILSVIAMYYVFTSDLKLI